MAYHSVDMLGEFLFMEETESDIYKGSPPSIFKNGKWIKPSESETGINSKIYCQVSIKMLMFRSFL